MVNHVNFLDILWSQKYINQKKIFLTGMAKIFSRVSAAGHLNTKFKILIKIPEFGKFKTLFSSIFCSKVTIRSKLCNL